MDPDVTIFACKACENFRSSSKPEMERHVAVVHGEGTFSTLKCAVCERKYYDFEHFTDHTKTTARCNSECLKVKSEPLPPHLQRAFSSLVDQMMAPDPQFHNFDSGKQEPETEEPIAVKEEIEIVDLSDDEDELQIQENPYTPSTLTPRSTLSQPSKSGKSVFQVVQSGPCRTEISKVETDQMAMDRHSLGPTASVDDQEIRGSGCMQRSDEKDYTIPEPTSMSTSAYCRQIVGKVEKALCSLCNRSFSTAIISNLLDHAERHMEKSVYFCQLCDRKMPNRIGMTSHVKRVHQMSASVDENYKSEFHRYRTEILQLFRTCFGTVGSYKCANVSTRDGPVTKHRKDSVKKIVGKKATKRVPSYVQHQQRLHCNKLIRKSGVSDKIRCNLCMRNLPVKSNGRINSLPSLTHSMKHLKIFMYRCSICNERIKSYYTVKNHMRKHHSAPVKGNYVDETDRYHGEIINILDKCFGRKDHDSMASSRKRIENKKKQGRPVGHRSMVMLNPKKLSPQVSLHLRQTYAGTLIRQRGESTKVECQLCSVIIDAKDNARNSSRISTFKVVQHVHEHLDRPLYHCRYCGVVMNSLLRMEPHLEGTHDKKLNSKDAYIDKTQLYHEEILALLRQCYGGKKTTVFNDDEIASTSGMQKNTAIKIMRGMQGNDNFESGESSKKSTVLNNALIFRCQNSGCRFATQRVLLYENHLKFFHQK